MAMAGGYWLWLMVIIDYYFLIIGQYMVIIMVIGLGYWLCG
jgi:hypothetical protein